MFDTFTYYVCFFFFFNDTATTEIYTLSLHDALPISSNLVQLIVFFRAWAKFSFRVCGLSDHSVNLLSLLDRSEEHTSELQSRRDLVCRLLLEKKKKKNSNKL